MNYIKKKKALVIFIIITLIIIIFLFAFKDKNDGMNNAGITKISYRTYTKEKGWSKWTKNGLTSGNFKDDILNIQVKVDKKEKGDAGYRIYSVGNNWSEEYSSNAEIKNQNITGVRFGLTGMLGKKSQICYRTYNDENKWMEWSCDGIINGNSNKNIKAIEIKIMTSNSSLEDYLKDYSKNEIRSVGFEGVE